MRGYCYILSLLPQISKFIHGTLYAGAFSRKNKTHSQINPHLFFNIFCTFYLILLNSIVQSPVRFLPSPSNQKE